MKIISQIYVSKKLNALGRIAGYITLEKRRILFKAFIESQFNDCPLIWMLHSQTMNNKINRLHERSLMIVYSDKNSAFEELLENSSGAFNFVRYHIPHFCSKKIQWFQFISSGIGRGFYKISLCSEVIFSRVIYELKTCLETVRTVLT